VASVAAVMMGAAPAAAQQQPPQLAIEGGCHEIERLDPMKVITFKSCMAQEEAGLVKLKEQWAKFSAADRNRCVDMTRSGSSPSYVEVLTCLQDTSMAREIEKSESPGNR
jgi:hypothetical protein